ncbi:hypothetical protein [Brevibacterium atlanticum]|uniref:hypothetical protein n=1 Tax=Brevibacterium atlanticum TaxID=2697563 RepID=UPI001D17F074|nr:hypothetical protein [Brevibacterium atlanticum]
MTSDSPDPTTPSTPGRGAADRQDPGQPTQGRTPAAGADIGALIGGAFGLLFLIINSAQFSSLGRTLVIALGTVVFSGILVFAVRGLVRGRGAGPQEDGARHSARHSADPQGRRQRREPPFGRAYWIIVLIEAIALFAGARLLTSLGHPELGVAWVAVVVGTHFFALGKVFGLDRFHVLATVVTLCGIGGFIAFFAAAPAFIPVISGVISGFVLLAFAMWALVPVEK